jgi:predicted nucleotide-binding protein
MAKENSDSKVTLSAKQYILNDEPDVVSNEIKERIDIGVKRLSEFRQAPKQFGVEALVKNFELDFRSWNDFNIALLKTAYRDPKIAEKYEQVGLPTEWRGLEDKVNKLDWLFLRKIAALRSLRTQMRFFAKATDLSKSTQTELKRFGNKVFIVHGHDGAVKLAVADTLKKLELDYIILHEQPDQGKTIIEKLETYSEDVDLGYAVVLLTPDDVGKSKEDKDEPKSRARQNVVFELGYFISKLGRARVRALYSKGVELPSDYQGVLYTLLDDAGAWRYELADELEAAGFSIDRNKLGRRKIG